MNEVEGDEFFAEDERALCTYRALAQPLTELDGVEVRVSWSRVAFRARKGFAPAWAPGRHQRTDVPIVASFVVPERIGSDRFKSVTHPSRWTWMHHVELRSAKEVDVEPAGWLTKAYEQAH